MLRAAEEAADGRVRREISPVPFHARLALTRPGHPAVRLQLRAAGTRFGQRHADPLTCRSCVGRHRGKPRSPLAHVAEAAEQSGQAVGLGEHELVAGDAWLGSRRLLVQLLQTALRPRELQPEPTAGGTRPDPAPEEGDLAGGSEIDLEGRQRALGRDGAREEEVPSPVHEVDVFPQTARAVDPVTQPQRHPSTSPRSA